MDLQRGFSRGVVKGVFESCQKEPPVRAAGLVQGYRGSRRAQSNTCQRRFSFNLFSCVLTLCNAAIVCSEWARSATVKAWRLVSSAVQFGELRKQNSEQRKLVKGSRSKLENRENLWRDAESLHKNQNGDPFCFRSWSRCAFSASGQTVS